MNDNIPTVELPEFATQNGHLCDTVAYARECVSYRVGYEVELASIVPVTRDNHTNLSITWRRKPPSLRVVSQGAGR